MGISDNDILALDVIGYDVACALGDLNQDGDVNFSDISPFIVILTNGGFLKAADTNQDGEVNFFDISPFIVLIAQ